MHQRARDAAVLYQVGDEIQHLRVPDGFDGEILAGCSSAGEHEDAAANDGADAQCGQRPRAERLLEAMLGVLRLRDQLVNGLLGEELRQGSLLIESFSVEPSSH